MSEYDGGGYGHDAGHLDTGHQHGDLQQNDQAYGNEHDHLQQFNAYGQDHNATDATHFANGHHVEYDTPNEHYTETDYTNYDQQDSQSDHSFGAEGSDQSHSQEFGQLDQLRSEFDTSFGHVSGLDSGGHGPDSGGHGELSAVSN